MKRVSGSVKDKVVATEIAQERANRDFDQYELAVALHGGEELYREAKDIQEDFSKHSELTNHFKYYEMTVDEQQQDLWRRIKFMYTHPELSQKYFKNFEVLKYPFKPWLLYFQGPVPGLGLNYSMFLTTVQIMANEEQKQRWLPKIMNCDIFGCYA